MQDLQKHPQGQNAIPELHLYPELYLAGYPLQDWIWHKAFVTSYLQHLQALGQFCVEQTAPSTPQAALVGGLEYTLDEFDCPVRIENVIYECRAGANLRKIYTKALLPNHDIFDEERYFYPQREAGIYHFAERHIGLMICEDMWPQGQHRSRAFDPTLVLQQKCRDEGVALDLLANLSASPAFVGKHRQRVGRAQYLSCLFEAPFAYVNRVGGEDEIVFDGSSFVVNGGELVHQCRTFEADLAAVPLPRFSPQTAPTCPSPASPGLPSEQTWDTLFRPSLDLEATPPQLRPLSPDDCDWMVRSLQLGVRDYADKCGFDHFLVAISGGIDSALVLALAKIIAGDSRRVEAIFMPGLYSSPLSRELATDMCQNLGIALTHWPIKFLHSTARHFFQDSFGEELEGLADQNIQARLRTCLLYARSNQKGAMVLNTSNKSELALGYSTLYGDSAGALSPLGDLYKSEVYQLAEHLNRTCQNPIPQGMIDRPPTAELKENQSDLQELFPYPRMDAILEGLLSYLYSPQDLIKFGFDEREVYKIYRLYHQSEYKRKQFCPIIKLKNKSFGFGHRMPIAKHTLK